MRIASSIALLAAVLLLAVATSMINTAIPTGSGLFTLEVGGQIAFGLFAGGIIRVLVPSAIAISLTAFWTILTCRRRHFRGMVAPLDGERHVRALSHTPIAHLDGGCGSRRTQDPPGGRCVLRRGRRDGQRVARCSNRLEPTHRGSFMNSNDSTHGTTEPSTPGDQTNAGGTPRLIGTRACLRCHHELAGQPINRVEPEGLLVVRCTECGQAKPHPRVSDSRPLGG
ncbi:MAG: hypothetical protein O3A31_09710, partial [Planctomycetota bacterium]|nr:hypothetical protein [Planctomycetota bacterium]